MDGSQFTVMDVHLAELLRDIFNVGGVESQDGLTPFHEIRG